MKKKDDKTALRSEQVQEILSSTPGRMVLYGNSLMLFITLVVFGGSYFVQYPKVISWPVVIRCTNPEQKVVAITSGYMSQVLVKDSSHVLVGTPLAVIQSSTDYLEVIKLKTNLEAVQLNDVSTLQEVDPLKLGDLRGEFLLLQSAYRVFNQETPTMEQVEFVSKSLERLRSAIEQWESKYVLKASIQGELTYFFYSKKHMAVDTGDVLFLIEPLGEHHYFGVMQMSLQQANQLTIGQHVDVRIDNVAEVFPITGVVAQKLMDPTTAVCTVFVDLVDASIGWDHIDRKGTAEVIVEDARLLERFLEVLRHR